MWLPCTRSEAILRLSALGFGTGFDSHTRKAGLLGHTRTPTSGFTVENTEQKCGNNEKQEGRSIRYMVC